MDNKLELIFQKIQNYTDTLSGNKTIEENILPNEYFEYIGIKSKNIKTIIKDFNNILNLFNKTTKNVVSIFNSNRTIFLIRENGLYIDCGWEKHILTNDLKHIKDCLYPFIYDTKEKLALIQDTHSHKDTNFNYYLVLLPIDNVITTLQIKDEQVYLNNAPQNEIKNLIIIENKECFFRYKEFLNNLYFDNLPILDKSTMIIYAEGNAITNKKLINYLQTFEMLHCFFDYDEYGFIMFDNIQHNNKKIYIPNTQTLKTFIELIYKHKTKLKSECITTNINNFEYKNKYFDTIQKIDIIKNKSEMIQIEQEVFLLQNEELENAKNIE